MSLNMCNVDEELGGLRALLWRRIVSRRDLPAEALPAVSVMKKRVERRIADFTRDADLDDDLLALIADLIEYRIALWSEPVPYVPTYAETGIEREWGQAIQEVGVSAELEELQYTSLGEVGEVSAIGPLVVIHVHNVGAEN